MKKAVVTWSTIPHGIPIRLCGQHAKTEPGLVSVEEGEHDGYCERCETRIMDEHLTEALVRLLEGLEEDVFTDAYEYREQVEEIQKTCAKLRRFLAQGILGG